MYTLLPQRYLQLTIWTAPNFLKMYYEKCILRYYTLVEGILYLKKNAKSWIINEDPFNFELRPPL